VEHSSPETLVALLPSRPAVVLFCRDRHGAPIGYPMTVLRADKDGALFTTYRKSKKVEHLQRDARVCVFAQGRDGEAPWCSLEGVASVWSPSAPQLDQAMGSTGGDPRVPPGMAEHVKQRIVEGKRVLVEVRWNEGA
jgi:general stress protein 26